METQVIQGILTKGDTVVVVALFLVALYLMVKMVVEAMKGYAKTQLLLVEKLEELSATVKAQTKMIGEQSDMIKELKEVIHKLYQELVSKAKIIENYENRKSHKKSS